jgi:hypothetical protein
MLNTILLEVTSQTPQCRGLKNSMGKDKTKANTSLKLQLQLPNSDQRYCANDASDAFYF